MPFNNRKRTLRNQFIYEPKLLGYFFTRLKVHYRKTKRKLLTKRVEIMPECACQMPVAAFKARSLAEEPGRRRIVKSVAHTADRLLLAGVGDASGANDNCLQEQHSNTHIRSTANNGSPATLLAANTASCTLIS